MITLGEKKISKIYLGTTPVKAVYLGEKKVWPEEEPGGGSGGGYVRPCDLSHLEIAQAQYDCATGNRLLAEEKRLYWDETSFPKLSTFPDKDTPLHELYGKRTAAGQQSWDEGYMHPSGTGYESCHTMEFTLETFSGADYKPLLRGNVYYTEGPSKEDIRNYKEYEWECRITCTSKEFLKFSFSHGGYGAPDDDYDLASLGFGGRYRLDFFVSQGTVTVYEPGKSNIVFEWKFDPQGGYDTIYAPDAVPARVMDAGCLIYNASFTC